MKMKALLAVALFVASASVARSQSQEQLLDKTQRQPQGLATTPTDSQAADALHDVITKPEPHLQKHIEPPPESGPDCTPYKHHLFNIHFDDRQFDTKCKTDLTPSILPYEYGPSRKKYWGAFAVAGASMVLFTEVHQRYEPQSQFGRKFQYEVGVSELSTIIAMSWPRLRRRNVENNYARLATLYTAVYTGLTIGTLIKVKH